MARRRKHYRGHSGLGSLVKFPGLGKLSLASSVKPIDVVIGLAAGVAGSVALQYGSSKLAAGGTAIPSVITSGSPLVGGLATAALLYLVERKKNSGRATGHALGAALGGAAVLAYSTVNSALVSASPAVAATAGWGFSPRTLPSGMGAPLFNNPRMMGYGGPIFNNPNTNMARLNGTIGFGDENEDGLFPAP